MFDVFVGARPLLPKKTLIGDSMIRDVVRLPNTRIYCKPGVKLVTLASDIFSKRELRYCLEQSDLVIVHAGTNDINTCSANELLDCIKKLVSDYRDRYRGHIGFSAIIPRPRDGKALSDRVKMFNQKLVAWCALNGCLCLRTYGPFLKGGRPRTHLFNKGRLHLSSCGPFPSGAYVLQNFLRSELSDGTLIPRIKEVEAKFYA